MRSPPEICKGPLKKVGASCSGRDSTVRPSRAGWPLALAKSTCFQTRRRRLSMDGGAIDDAPGACDGECSKALEAAEKGNSAVLHQDLLIREKCLSLLVAAVRKRKRTASNCFSLLAATLEEKDRAQCAADDISKDLLPPRKAATEGKTDSGHQTTRDGTTRAPHSQARKKIAGKSTILEGARHDLGPSLKGNEDRVGEAASAAKTNSDAKDTAMAQRHTGVCPKACCGECLTVEEVQQVLAALDSGDEAGLEAAACLLLGEEGHKGPAALTLKQPWVLSLPFVPPSPCCCRQRR